MKKPLRAACVADVVSTCPCCGSDCVRRTETNVVLWACLAECSYRIEFRPGQHPRVLGTAVGG